MSRTWKDPVGATTPLPGLGNCLRGQAQITTVTAADESPSAPYPVRMLARRFGLSLPTASTVAALAGMAGAA